MLVQRMMSLELGKLEDKMVYQGGFPKTNS